MTLETLGLCLVLQAELLPRYTYWYFTMLLALFRRALGLLILSSRFLLR